MRKWSLILAVVLLSSCAVNLKKITKNMSKLNDIGKVNYLRSEIFENPKSELDAKQMALQAVEVNEFYSMPMNNYLRDDLFAKLTNLSLKNQTFNLIVKMGYPQNSDFFWEQITNNTAYKNQALDALKGLGLEGFKAWKDRMRNPAYSYDIHQIFVKEKDWINAMMDYFLFLPDSQAVEMNEYLLENQSLVVSDIIERIQKKEVTDYQEIYNVVELYDHMTLSEYDVLFESDDEKIFSILHNIYQFYIGQGFLNLHLLYTSTEELDVRLRIIEMNKLLAETSYRDNLEKYIVDPKTDKEEKVLIKNLIDMYQDFPEVFYPLIKKRDFFFNLKTHIPAFLENQPESFKNAFIRTDNFGKINIIEYLFENQLYEILNDYLTIIDIKRYISEDLQYTWNFVVANALKHDAALPNIIPIVKDMILVDNPVTLQTASLFIKTDFQTFEDYLVDKLTFQGTSLDKWEILAENFIHTRKDSTFAFLLNKMSEMKQRNGTDVINKIASVLAQNRNFNYVSLIDNELVEPEKWKIALIAGFMNVSHIGQSRLDNYFIENFFDFSNEERMKIISCLQNLRQNGLLEFFINNYDKLEIAEQYRVNSIITLFPFSSMIENHLRKLVLVGNADNLKFVEDFVSVNDIDSKSIKSSLKNRYFRDFDFDKYEELKLNDMSNIDDIVADIAKTYLETREFCSRYDSEFMISSEMPHEVTKAIADSMTIYSEIAENPLINYNKIEASAKVNKFENDLDYLKGFYSRFFNGIKEHQVFMNSFFVEVIRSQYLDELIMGRLRFDSEIDSRFVNITLKISNPGVKSVNVFQDKFILITELGNIVPTDAGDGYLQYLKKFNPKNIPAQKSKYMNLFFEVPYDLKEFDLGYSVNDKINIIEPINFKPEYKEYNNGNMREY